MDPNQLTVEEFIARQPKYERWRRWILHPGLRLIVRLAAHLEITGLEHVPASGGVIVMMNHISTMDPPFITAVIRHRHCITMAKIETKNNLLIETANNWWGNFKVRRGEVDRFALNAAIELVRHGQMLLMSPEGTRNRDGLREPRDGLAYIAHKSNAIIQPAAIAGVLDWRERLMRFRRIYARINFGRPFRFRSVEGDRLTKALRAQMMQEAMYQLALAIPEPYTSLRGHYADVENATTDTLEFL
jgi:1-acyl-sn-glycerol-3-phosphate acyltransferase